MGELTHLSPPTTIPVSSEVSTHPTDSTSPDLPTAASSKEDSSPPPPPDPMVPVRTVSEDPRYARFFRMVRMGVPLQAVKNKMKAEGLSGDILDPPEAPSDSTEEVTEEMKQE